MSRGALALVVLLALAGASLAWLDQLTRERISEQAERRLLADRQALLQQYPHNNHLIQDVLDSRLDALNTTLRWHRARWDDTPVAVVADVTTPRGYSGDIRLLVAIEASGRVIGVRVIEHRETPGLGDAIDHRRSNWIEQFVGRQWRRDEASAWAPNRRGGQFDTLTSATLTSAAVIEAVAAVLQLQQALGEALWVVEEEP